MGWDVGVMDDIAGGRMFGKESPGDRRRAGKAGETRALETARHAKD